MSALENAILTLNRLNAPAAARGIVSVDGRASLAVTLVYMVAVLSFPLTSPVRMLILAGYPIVASALCGIGYGRIFIRSLCLLPIVGVFAIFNPVFDPANGWITFAGIILRGLLTFQALLILIETQGYIGMCGALSQLHVPAVLTTQLMMVYRYLIVLLSEALAMQRARRARGYGRRHLSIAEWGRFIGQLFIRTVNRAERIHGCMLARGFSGSVPRFNGLSHKGWGRADWVWLLGWCAAIAAMRFIDVSSMFHFRLP